MSWLFKGVNNGGNNQLKLIVRGYTEKKIHRLLDLSNINSRIKKMEYAVRGPLLLRANEIDKELAAGKPKPFKQTLKANVGDAHAMGQKPITFFRQVLALVCYPELLSKNDFPSDVVHRAEELLASFRGGSVGSYTESFGIEMIRQHAAEFIEKRDGIKPEVKNIMLSNGASVGIKNILRLLNEQIDGKLPGVLVPIPQYPLYSASLAELGMHLIGYYLDESKNWGLNMQEVRRALEEGRKVSYPRAIVVINPGNPTGQVLTKENIIEIIKFAYDEKLFIFADEVYMDNVYAEGSQFHSFRKTMLELGPPYDGIEMACFFSCSKGYMGECGIRGAYTELVNMDEEVRLMLLKCVSSMLCPSAVGQALLDCVVKHPEKGEPSYDLFIKEKTAILGELKKRAKIIEEGFNSMKGFSCNEVQGAMYAFPRIEIPEKAIKAAKNANLPPDTFYAFQLLENTGVCIIPGSGFGQVPGTYHFRTTILPKTELLMEMIQIFRSFHEKFLKEYS